MHDARVMLNGTPLQAIKVVLCGNKLQCFIEKFLAGMCSEVFFLPADQDLLSGVPCACLQVHCRLVKIRGASPVCGVG